MSTHETRAIVHTCDQCGSRTIEVEEGEPPFGISISWSEVGSTGGWGGKFWVCSEKCLRRAIVRRIEIDQEQEERSRG